MPLRVGDSMYVYLHGKPVNHENQPSVGKYIYINIISDNKPHQIGLSCNMNNVPLQQK